MNEATAELHARRLRPARTSPQPTASRPNAVGSGTGASETFETSTVSLLVELVFKNSIKVDPDVAVKLRKKGVNPASVIVGV